MEVKLREYWYVAANDKDEEGIVTETEVENIWQFDAQHSTAPYHRQCRENCDKLSSNTNRIKNKEKCVSAPHKNVWDTIKNIENVV